eukprot:TRINITY_DN68159_c0_g1_i1.p1 TRINITY_DN68159_c0_g1~~TRINITY_DN68159_c0_g1_i1.p1  ORF type:complete len:156 (-),score=26.96 TRINITY_DN68159_c0_g1_i1:331-798(-)
MFRSVLPSAARSLRLAPVGARLKYSPTVIDHYKQPRNVGTLDKNQNNVGTGLVGAPACGDVMQLQIAVDNGGTIVEAKFKTFGCGSAIASSSYATTVLIGKHISDAMKITNQDIASELKLPPVKLHCSMLAEQAIQASILDYVKKNTVPTAELKA